MKATLTLKMLPPKDPRVSRGKRLAKVVSAKVSGWEIEGYASLGRELYAILKPQK